MRNTILNSRKNILIINFGIVFLTLLQFTSCEKVDQKSRIQQRQYNKAIMYLSHYEDTLSAIKWLKRSANNGNNMAQKKLGDLYYDGWGNEGKIPSINRFGLSIKDSAIFWYEKSAKQGNIKAQLKLSYIYSNSLFNKNKERAFYWFKKAAEQGSVKGQFALAFNYLNGEGTAIDTGQAVYWFKKAAEQGHVNAQYNLGISHIILHNYKEAAYWIKKAYKNGNHSAKNVWEKYKLWEYE